MLHRSVVLLSLVVLTASGCTHAENGLISPDEREAVFEPDLVGVWETTRTDRVIQETNKTYLKVERDHPGSKAYRVTECGEDGKPTPLTPGQPPNHFQAYVVRIGDDLFLDIPMVFDESQQRSRQMEAHFFYGLKWKKNEIVVSALDLEYVAGHRELLPSAAELNLPLEKLKSFDLRLVFDARDETGLPQKAQSLVAVACAGPSPYVLIFDEAGKVALSLDLARLKDLEPEVAKLKTRLDEFKAPRQLTPESQAEIIAQIRLIYSHRRPDRILATPEEWRAFLAKHARSEAIWKNDNLKWVLRRR